MDEETIAPEEQVSEKPKKSKKKLGIILGVIVVVLVAAVAGGLIWHEQPSFCGAICHTPMDPYYEGYESGDTTLLITTHKKANAECLDCHIPTLSQQIAEGTHWITGDYVFNYETDRLELRDEFASEEFCLNADCHNMTVEDLAVATEDLAWNPHNTSQHGQIACSSCHRMHSPSVMYCAQCHAEAKKAMPEGWAASEKEAEALLVAAAAAK
ncbi:MAG: cytochrome c3 family protein [Actinobacteria bacterium]|nr:cytochrome c3 family protein [Actinomycetota bacterium]